MDGLFNGAKADLPSTNAFHVFCYISFKWKHNEVKSKLFILANCSRLTFYFGTFVFIFFRIKIAGSLCLVRSWFRKWKEFLATNGQRWQATALGSCMASTCLRQCVLLLKLLMQVAQDQTRPSFLMCCITATWYS